MRNAFKPFERFRVGAYRGGGSFSPASLFANGEAGGWFDPSDKSTLFQDAAGTTPVPASGQPVGLMLDKSKRLVLGPELVTNGDFGLDVSGWSVGGATIARDASVFPSGGMLVTVAGATNTYATQVITGLTAGRTYKLSCRAYSPSGQGLNRAVIGTQATSFTQQGSNPQQSLDTVQTLSLLFTAGGPNKTIYCSVASENLMAWGTTGCFAFFDDVSVCELPGNHATQPDAAKRPLYQSAGGLSWLKSDLIDDSLPATVPSLGTNATVWHATEGVTTILTGQTIGAGVFETLRGEKTYAVGAINRALTGPETASLTAYLDAARMS